MLKRTDENARLGRKVNFARGKVPSGARAPENVSIVCQPTARGRSKRVTHVFSLSFNLDFSRVNEF